MFLQSIFGGFFMINERLRELRVAAGLSQSQIAQMLDLTQTSIQRYESNRAEAPYRVMLWYANHFDVSLDWVYGRCDKPQGQLYNYEPETFRKKLENEEEWKQFVKACFEPNSPLNVKLQEAIMKLSTGGDKE